MQEQYQVDRWGMVEASGMGGHDIDGLCLSLLMSLSPSLSLSLSPSETETLIWLRCVRLLIWSRCVRLSVSVSVSAYVVVEASDLSDVTFHTRT